MQVHNPILCSSNLNSPAIQYIVAAQNGSYDECNYYSANDMEIVLYANIV